MPMHIFSTTKNMGLTTAFDQFQQRSLNWRMRSQATAQMADRESPQAARRVCCVRILASYNSCFGEKDCESFSLSV